MKIVPIFEGDIKAEDCNLWAVIYPGHGEEASNVFKQLFDLWNDTQYLQNFFISHQKDLLDPIWKGIAINDAIDQVLDEAEDFELELKYIETKHPGYENTNLDEVFEHLHKNEFIHKRRNAAHRKARPYMANSMLRIYAIRLDDGCFIITGGGIKLTDRMQETELEKEIPKLERLQDYLKTEGISSREGLLTS